MKAVLAITAMLLNGCSLSGDDNDSAQYGSSGMPKNCRAYVQAAVDGYRSKQYSAEDTMAGLERNCGTSGHIWKNNR